MRKERDKEIELVIERLEADMSSAKEECERAAESRSGQREEGACDPSSSQAGVLPRALRALSLQRWAEPRLAFPPLRIKRIRDKYEVELQELERSERKLQERCNELKGRLVELEGESVRLQGLLKHKEQEVEEIRKVGEKQSCGDPGPLRVPLASPSLSPLCPAAGEGPVGPGAEQPGRRDPSGIH